MKYSRIIFVSAFTALRTLLRLREQLKAHTERGTMLRFVIGIDLGGTSREVLEELLRWNCEAVVFHNTLARATFHPKIYFFEAAAGATIFIGSNNLTDGGFYTNYEVSTRYDFGLPGEAKEYKEILGPLSKFISPTGATVRVLDKDLILTLVARGELPSEAEARQRLRRQYRARRPKDTPLPTSPFASVATPLPPLLPEAESPEPIQPPTLPTVTPPPHRTLVWRKVLPQTDALQVAGGTNPVGGVRLTQAGFENPPGQRIDQTIYFRELFADYGWGHEVGRYADQEHAFVPMRVIIRGNNYGIRYFEISHKPSGEAGQANYTTILRWGRDFSPIVRQQKLTGAVFSLYETDEEDSSFLIDIT